MFIWGKHNDEVSNFFFCFTVDLGIPGRILRFLCADVSIARGILMFIWGKPNAEVSNFFFRLMFIWWKPNAEVSFFFLIRFHC